MDKINEKLIYQHVKEKVDELKKTHGAVKINFAGISKDVINKICIMLQNDGIYVDKENFVLIWDKYILMQYTKQINAVCIRRCNKKEKAKCTGCIEYNASTPLHLINQNIKILA